MSFSAAKAYCESFNSTLVNVEDDFKRKIISIVLDNSKYNFDFVCVQGSQNLLPSQIGIWQGQILRWTQQKGLQMTIYFLMG